MITFAVSLSLAAVALAGPAIAPADPVARAGHQRVVMECGTDDATRRAYQREHGAPPVFMSHREVLNADRVGQTWEAPRCMTSRQHALLQRVLRTGR